MFWWKGIAGRMLLVVAENDQPVEVLQAEK